MYSSGSWKDLTDQERDILAQKVHEDPSSLTDEERALWASNPRSGYNTDPYFTDKAAAANPLLAWFSNMVNGTWWNKVSGVSATQDWQSREREAQESYATSERIAGEQFTHNENELARDWQERMSNTAIQRQMADAQAAGVNPYYLFGAGNAQGAGVAMASGSSGTAQGASAPSAPGSGNSAAAVAATVSAIGGIVGSIVKALS